VTQPPRHADARVARIVSLFEHLTSADVGAMEKFYAPDAQFKDPFNEVQGVPHVQRIFDHMFEVLREPRFVVHDILAQDDQCFLTWEFVFRLKRWSGAPHTVRGSTHLRFAQDGRIQWHRDYWDAAEELYEKLPVLGALMRWLRNRVNS